eukprot:TRINITY_DN6218_c0_g1_i3.p1 TRINITY_DN6218_c0_g1~~TRINITY_DN6218_c0_g1_i3.p1  ORF type:complete len:598 (+),score=50.39 TRINITY_DN6218_c0_g1_i3:699-2492(+)
MYDRVETFEGVFSNSEEFPLTSITLLEAIQRTCLAMVNHYLSIPAFNKMLGGVSRMILNFKFDAKNVLHFLWCESLRLTPKESPPPAPLEFASGIPEKAPAKKGVEALAHSIYTTPFDMHTKLRLPVGKLQGEVYGTCALCDRDHNQNTLHSVAYRTLLAALGELGEDEQVKPVDSPKLTAKSTKTNEIKTLRLRMLQMHESERGEIRATTVRQGKNQDRRRSSVADGLLRSAPHGERKPKEHKPAIELIDSATWTKPSEASEDNELALLRKVDDRSFLCDPLAALASLISESKNLDGSITLNRASTGAALPVSCVPGSVATSQGVPKFIRKLHPYITWNDYDKARHRADFQKIRVLLCSYCFMELTSQFRGERMDITVDEQTHPGNSVRHGSVSTVSAQGRRSCISVPVVAETYLPASDNGEQTPINLDLPGPLDPILLQQLISEGLLSVRIKQTAPQPGMPPLPSLCASCVVPTPGGIRVEYLRSTSAPPDGTADEFSRMCHAAVGPKPARALASLTASVSPTKRRSLSAASSAATNTLLPSLRPYSRSQLKRLAQKPVPALANESQGTATNIPLFATVEPTVPGRQFLAVHLRN